MPDCDALYLIEHLFDVGPVMHGGMGMSPLSHQELNAWQSNIGFELQPWEVRAMHRLSHEYLSQLQKSAAYDEPAPWVDAPYVKSAPNVAAIRMQRAMIELSKQ